MKDIYTYNLNSDEDCCLLDIIQYFDDVGLPEQIDAKAFATLRRSSPFLINSLLM